MVVGFCSIEPHLHDWVDREGEDFDDDAGCWEENSLGGYLEIGRLFFILYSYLFHYFLHLFVKIYNIFHIHHYSHLPTISFTMHISLKYINLSLKNIEDS